MNHVKTGPVFLKSFRELPEVLEQELPIQKNRVMLVGDTNTIPLYGEAVASELRKVFREVGMFAFEAGEEHKTLDSVKSLLAYLIDSRYDRKDCIAALGGGVVGDMAGFAAAIFLRGIPVIQIPTSLLAQIDSSIGGKTGVDFDGYKNMIGAFHMPALVCTCPAALATLPEEQFRAGMGEVVKSALLADADLCGFLVSHAEEIRNRDEDVLFEMIRRTCAIKAEIVRRDPTEQGERALLNLGHTIGHAVEKACHFSRLHGECVGIGLNAAAYMSLRRGKISEEEYQDILHMCALFGIPDSISGLTEEEILRNTKSDKKMAAGQIRFILLEKPGRAYIADDVTDEEMLCGIRRILQKE